MKAECQICMKNEHKYRCPRCSMLTCSLPCSKEHKSKHQCSGIKDHVATLNVKMQDFRIGTMRKDLKFLDDAINISNKSKKEAVPIIGGGGPGSGLSKKVKNLRYFLRKKRNIVYKHSPSNTFSRSLNNTTYFDTSSGQDKFVLWTLELIFLKRTARSLPPSDTTFQLFRDCETLATIVLNHANMIHEETTLASFLTKPHLKQFFYNETFSLLLSRLDDHQLASAPVYIKRV